MIADYKQLRWLQCGNRWGTATTFRGVPRDGSSLMLFGLAAASEPAPTRPLLLGP